MQCLLRFFVAVLLTAPAFAQQAFETHLVQLQSAIEGHRKAINERQQYELLKSIQQRNSTLNLAMATTAPTIDHGPVLTALQNVLGDLAIGEASVFTGSGIANVDVTWEGQTTVWKSDYVRNGFDTVKPYLDWVGTGLTGASLVLSANGSSGATGKSTAISGAGILVVSSVLQHFFGSKQLNNAAGKVNSVSVNVSQIMMSREAYNQIENRTQMVNKYYAQAKAQIATLQAYRDALADMQQNPDHATKAALLQLIDQVSAARDQYQTNADFVDAYTTQLMDLYDRYAAEYTPLAGSLNKTKTSVNTFKGDYDNLITGTLLKNFPKYKGLLIDLRAQVGQEP